MVLKNLIIFLVLSWYYYGLCTNTWLKEVSKPNIEKQEQLITDEITMTLIPYRLVHPLNVMSIEQTMTDK